MVNTVSAAYSHTPSPYMSHFVNAKLSKTAVGCSWFAIQSSPKKGSDELLKVSWVHTA